MDASWTETREYIVPSDNTLTREQLIRHYFGLGFSYMEIVLFLGVRHGIHLTMRHLKRLLRMYGLSRRQNKDDLETVTRVIQEELRESGGNLGYRSMHQKLTQLHHVTTDRETVRYLLQTLDPVGVLARKQRRLVRRSYQVKGPNYLWHLDGWDKLKPYGFSVHGCIDGFSRKIMWLEIGPTNKDPFVVASNFIRTINSLKGVPNIIRADRGTENVNIEVIQTHLRALNIDQRGQLQASFLYGKSTTNQRIESWWSQFKQHGMQFWIDHFKELVNIEIFNTSDEANIQCARFCYMDLLRREMDQIKILWNTHHIRRSRTSFCPAGKPDFIFHFPELYDSRNFLKPLHQEELVHLADSFTREVPDYSVPAEELFSGLMSDARIDMPNSVDEADDLFVFLLDSIQSLE